MKENVWLPIGVPLDHNPPEIPVINLPIKSKNQRYAEVLFSGCKHFGNESQSLNQLRAHLNLLQKLRHLRAVDMGDIVDLTDFRPRYLGASDTVRGSIAQASQYLEPIADKVDLALYGNHDSRLMEQTLSAFNWLGVFWKLMGAKAYVGRPGRGLMAIFKAEKQEYPIYAFHSRTGAIVNEFLALQRALKNISAPLIAGGHVHRTGWRFVTTKAPTKINGIWYDQVYRSMLLLTGCFMKWPAYSEEKAYPLTDIGAPIVRFAADRYQLEVVDPRTHYAEFFDEPSDYKPNLDFSIDKLLEKMPLFEVRNKRDIKTQESTKE